MRFELTTSTLARLHSTTELRPHMWFREILYMQKEILGIFYFCKMFLKKKITKVVFIWPIQAAKATVVSSRNTSAGVL